MVTHDRLGWPPCGRCCSSSHDCVMCSCGFCFDEEESEWKELGLDYPLEGINPPTKERVENAKKILTI